MTTAIALARRAATGAALVHPGPLILSTILILLAGMCGCASSGSQAPARTALAAQRQMGRAVELEPIKLMARGPGSRVEVLDAMGLFEAGGRQLAVGNHRAAAQRYEQLVAQFPTSRLVSPALYNLGLAHEGLDQFDHAAKHYAELIRRFGSSRDSIDAAFRLGACLAEIRDWKGSAAAFARILQRKDLSASDRVEALARKGLAHFRLGDHDATRRTLHDAVRFVQRVDPLERLQDDFFIGMAYYYLAAIPHAQFRSAAMHDGPRLAGRLDEKARLLLLAQGRYIKTIRLKHPYWATAAGFQIGSLYREFYTTLMTTAPDLAAAAKRNARRSNTSLAEAREQLHGAYLETLHQRIKPLLQKAIRVFERNTVVATRIGVRSDWVTKSRRQVEDLKRLLTATPREAVGLLPEHAAAPEDQPPKDQVPGPESAPAEASDSVQCSDRKCRAPTGIDREGQLLL